MALSKNKAPPKNIVICCDGTGNEYGTNKTNVVRVAEIAKVDASQAVYYDHGVGTGGWSYDVFGGRLKGVYENATGQGLQKNIEDAYRFLMQTYEAGDKVFLLGFSRGAYTVRSLGGMLFQCGLLRRGMDNLVEQASKIYNRKDDNLDARFKATFSRSCPVHFIGVWDTVESLMLNAGRKFHNPCLSEEISNAYHAIALDEVRKDFPPYLWDEASAAPGQVVEQVWFAGVHSDVGGWYEQRGLSDIALKWMLKGAKKHGMKLKEKGFTKVKGDPLGKQHDSHKGFWNLRGKHKRQVPPGGKVHTSVKKRMENSDYQPVKPLPDDVKFVS